MSARGTVAAIAAATWLWAGPAAAIFLEFGNVEFDDPACVYNGRGQLATIPDHQCLMKAPPPPEDEPFTDSNTNGIHDAGEFFEDWNEDGKWSEGDAWGKANGGGWMVHLRWCLGQTKVVTNTSYARRVTHIYPDAEKEKDTWSLLPSADCNDPALRSLAGIPPLGADLPREQEMCAAFQSPDFVGPDGVDPIVGFKVYQQPGSHHLLIWDVIHSCNTSNGDDCTTGNPFRPGGVNEWDSFVCSSVTSDTDRSVTSGAQSLDLPVSFPDDGEDVGHGEPGHEHLPLVGMNYGKNHYFLFNHHLQRYAQWDPTQSAVGEAWINYYRAPKKPRNKARILFEALTGDATIFIPPHTVGKPQGVWYPPKWPAWVFGLTAHMHQRGLAFITNKTPLNPPLGTGHSDPNCNNLGNPFGALYYTNSWSDPANCLYAPTPDNLDAQPIRFDVGEGLRYECIINNGVKATNELPAETREAIRPYFSAREPKWACEEFPGVTPGIPFIGFSGDRATAPCTPPPNGNPLGELGPDPDCCEGGITAPCNGKMGQIRRSTGRCVPASTYFGPSRDDDMCLLPGIYWMDENGTSSGFPTQ